VQRTEKTEKMRRPGQNPRRTGQRGGNEGCRRSWWMP